MLLPTHFLLLALAAGTSAQPFSPTFQAAVEQAFKAPSAEQRVEMLAETVRTGSDSEVVRAIGAYFPHDIMKTARADNVCSSEISGLLGLEDESKKSGTDDYLTRNTVEYRQLLIDAIRCVHLAYADGIPMRE